jgi:hypothetical protein
LGRIEFLRSMRKRRVGVTARSWRNVGNQATGALQFGTEMAAPLELRTPAGTCGKGCNQSADGSMATMARGSQRAEKRSKEHVPGKRKGAGSGEPEARLRRSLKLRQGASPLRPPAPFPSAPMFQNGGNPSRVRKPRRNGAPLTDCHRSEDFAEMRERGPLARRAASRVSPGGSALRAHEALPHTPSGGKPPETPAFSLDREWPSHGSHDRKGVVAGQRNSFSRSRT